MGAQESHGSPVHCLCFNLEERRCSNLFATVGKDQATVYDDAHMGDHISVVLNFENKRTQHTRGGVSGDHGQCCITAWPPRQAPPCDVQ